MSLRGAINAMCKQCIYDPLGGSGTWRQQVEACTARHCALYPVRPTARRSAESVGTDENGAKSAPSETFPGLPAAAIEEAKAFAGDPQ